VNLSVLRMVPLLVLPALALTALSAQVSGCGASSYLLLGQIYDPAADCLAAPTAIDVLAGSEPDACPPRCIVGPPLGNGASGATVTYVIQQCGKVPVTDEASGTAATCPGALAAFARKGLCKGDAGVRADAAADVVEAAAPDAQVLDAAAADAVVDATADTAVDSP
jgi:hypothetical protein